MRQADIVALVQIVSGLPAQRCKTVRTCPSPEICRTATAHDMPGVVARRAFCKFPGWGMSERNSLQQHIPTSAGVARETSPGLKDMFLRCNIYAQHLDVAAEPFARLHQITSR